MKLWHFPYRVRSPRQPGREQRQAPRYLLAKPIFAIPIALDGSPEETCGVVGLTIDVSSGGIQCEVQGVGPLASSRMLLGIEGTDEVLHFATVEIRHREAIAGAVRVGASFVSGRDDLLCPENLLPTFRRQTGRFEFGLPPTVLEKWRALGILRPRLIERILVCPQCHALPIFSQACRACGSSQLDQRPLLHHFACAHVGQAGDFERDGHLGCPKCLAKHLVVGADCEHWHGPVRCLECGGVDSEVELLGRCPACEFRFPLSEALSEDLIGYDVHRLDPLALLAAR